MNNFSLFTIIFSLISANARWNYITNVVVVGSSPTDLLWQIVAQFGRARMFHQQLVADFQMRKRMPIMTTSSKCSRHIHKLVASLFNFRMNAEKDYITNLRLAELDELR